MNMHSFSTGAITFLALLILGTAMLTPSAHAETDASTPATTKHHPWWTPSYRYEEDNFNRQYWQTTQQIGVELTKRISGFIEYLHASFREQAIPHVREDAVGAGVRSTLSDQHKLQLKALEHNFSGPVERQLSWEAEVDSHWTDKLRTRLLVGREPADTAQALQSGIRQNDYEAMVEWTPWERWHVSGSGSFRRLSDQNHRYTTTWQLGRELPWVPGLQAVVLYSFDNMVERHAAYYSPHRVKSVQAGFSYWGTPTPKTWVWGRYVPGYGDEEGVGSWFVHVLDLSAGIHLTPNWTIDAALGLSRSPTYRSRTYTFSSTLKF